MNDKLRAIKRQRPRRIPVAVGITAPVAEDVPLENIEAICCALEKYSTYYS